MSKKIFTLLAVVLMMVTVLSVMACNDGDDAATTAEVEITEAVVGTGPVPDALETVAD